MIIFLWGNNVTEHRSTSLSLANHITRATCLLHLSLYSVFIRSFCSFHSFVFFLFFPFRFFCPSLIFFSHRCRCSCISSSPSVEAMKLHRPKDKNMHVMTLGSLRPTLREFDSVTGLGRVLLRSNILTGKASVVRMTCTPYLRREISWLWRQDSTFGPESCLAFSGVAENSSYQSKFNPPRSLRKRLVCLCDAHLNGGSRSSTVGIFSVPAETFGIFRPLTQLRSRHVVVEILNAGGSARAAVILSFFTDY